MIEKEIDMNTIDATPVIRTSTPEKLSILGAIHDTRILMKRNLRRVIRTPRLLIFSSIQPIMFFVLFRYVFGGPLKSTGAYVDFLLPGIFVQASLFGGTTAIALSTDLASGMIDRFKSLPIARVSVLAGRTLADAIRNIATLGIFTIAGFIMGFRFHNGFFPIFGAYGLMLLFTFAFSWMQAYIGIISKDPETAQIASFIPLFPFIFASTIFQPVANFPSWLQGFAAYQPVGVLATTMRSLTQGGPVWDSAWKALMWTAIFLIIFIPLSVWKYRKI